MRADVFVLQRGSNGRRRRRRRKITCKEAFSLFFVFVGVIFLHYSSSPFFASAATLRRKHKENRQHHVLSSGSTIRTNPPEDPVERDGIRAPSSTSVVQHLIRPMVRGVSASMETGIQKVTQKLVSKLSTFVDETLSKHSCDYNCIQSVITRAEKHTGGSDSSSGVDFIGIVDNARQNMRGDGNIVKLAFGLIADVIYVAMHIIVPDLRSVVVDKWSEIRERARGTLGDVVPGGALALRSTSILDDVREILEAKTHEPVEEICHMLPEVGVNLGVMADVPLGEYCVVVSSHLIEITLLHMSYVLEQVLRNAKRKFRDEPLIVEGIDMIGHIVTNPVGSLIREFTGKIRTETGEITTTLTSKVTHAVKGVLERAKRDDRASPTKKAIVQELEDEVDFMYTSDCSVKHESLPEEIICEIDKAVLTGSVILDKSLIWSEIVQRVRMPLFENMQRLSMLIERAGKMVKGEIETIADRVEDVSDSAIHALEHLENTAVGAHGSDQFGVKQPGEPCDDHPDCESGFCYDIGLGGKCTA